MAIGKRMSLPLCRMYLHSLGGAEYVIPSWGVGFGHSSMPYPEHQVLMAYPPSLSGVAFADTAPEDVTPRGASCW